MSEQLALPTALDALERYLHSGFPVAPEELSQVLRVLQRLGLSKHELMVHVERLRAVNEHLQDDEQVEENALLALEMIEGSTVVGLSWTSAELAAAWVPRTVGLERLRAGASYALAPTDLLPSRPELHDQSGLKDRLIDRQWAHLQQRSYLPSPAQFFRSPKEGLTSRPAALLAPQDRLIYEALIQPVAEALDATSPQEVFWPRGRHPQGDHSGFVATPRAWRASFIVRTDIESYYECIDHSYLALMISENLGIGGAFPIALESFLDTVMKATVGIPQGPPGSDILASAYLADIDRTLSRMGWDWCRYADDILIGASSFAESRARLRELETFLRERGLRLSRAKTRVLRQQTYLRNLDESRERSAFRKAIEREVTEWLESRPDLGDLEETLRGFGVPEELLWNSLYHQSISLPEALAQVQDRLVPEWVAAYERFFAAEAERLEAGGYADDYGALSTSDLRECLLIMTGARQSTRFANLGAVLDWHPTLVRDISSYLAAVGAAHPDEVGEFIRARIGGGKDGDLELAWILSAAVQESRIAQCLVSTLDATARYDDRRLTRAIAARALAATGRLTSDTWSIVLQGASAALRAELLLAREADPGRFPHEPSAGGMSLPEPGESGDWRENS